MNYRFLLTLIIGLFCLQPIYAQVETQDVYSQRWSDVDSLMAKGLPKSAIKTVQRILEDARQNGDGANEIKAQLFIIGAERQVSEGSDSNAIRKAETAMAKAVGVEKALWQSITAQMYWNYYQQNRYKILRRTSLSKTTSTDIATWDAPAFFRKIGNLYQTSLSNQELLKSMPTTRYAPIISEGKNTRHLRPTLFDLLSFRALDFFKNDEKDLLNPAYQFEMDGRLWFDEAAKFALLKVKIKDSSSLHFQALRLYQEIIAFHLNDKKLDALIDANLHRLEFVYQNSTHADKDSLYLNALLKLESHYLYTAAISEVSFKIAQLKLGDYTTYNHFYGRPSFSKTDRDIPKIKKEFEAIFDKYPKSEGGIHAFNLLQQLEAKTLELQVEDVYLPNENIKVLLSYKNTDHVYLSLFKVPNTPALIAGYNNDEEALLKKVRRQRPIRVWEQQLPGSEDMEAHSTEIKVDALPLGAYLLTISSKKDLNEEANIIGTAKLQVSNLSLIELKKYDETRKLYVLNRKHGKPIADASLIFWSRGWRKSEKEYYYRKARQAQSDNNGKVLWKPSLIEFQSNVISVVARKDTLQLSGYFNYETFNNYERRIVDREFTFLFTDRSIYRPGQTLYFKGILVNSSENRRENNIVPNTQTVVILRDANRQEIDSISLKTNEFGSFSGKFTLPANGLTGGMSISSGSERTYFSVEEYKRPKFYVSFHALKGNFALNQKVNVKGLAKAYAGNTIDGAKVKYRVVRRARFPYFWCRYRWGMPSSPQMEITNGTSITGADGSFDISFQTLPDKSVNPKALPVFSYTVYADVTDINGETRSAEQVINAGYTSLQIIANIAEQCHPEDLDSLLVSTQNLNGVFVPAELKISVSKLKFPGKIYRQRLWEKPDQFAMTETEFRAAFPDDEYKDEGDYRTWERAESVFESSFTTQANGKIPIPTKTWKHEGWYVIELSGEDAQGNTVLEKKYTYISIPGKNSEIQKPFVVQASKNSYQPGETAEIWLSAGFEDVHLLKKSSLDKFPVPSKKGIYKHIITESDRGGIGFSWLYVHNNRVYTAAQTLSVPWSNKELQLEWATHRNKLLPGATEEWTLTIKGNKKEMVAAELLAGMYDASLDAFKPHSWRWDRLLPRLQFRPDWRRYGFRTHKSSLQTYQTAERRNYAKTYDKLALYDYSYASMVTESMVQFASASQRVMVRGVADNKEVLNEVVVVGYGSQAKRVVAGAVATEPLVSEEEKDEVQPPLRKNFNETAFFFPQLQTDEEGNVKFKFTIPEALTQWKFMAFAHTKDWKTGYLQGSIKTQKDLMVMPNLPRFLRQGDDIVISTKISNLSDKDLKGTATLEILNALTLQPVDLPFRLMEKNKTFAVKQNQSTQTSWSLHVPENMYAPVVLRISAQSGNFTDGEENTLPIISNRMLVTETLPLSVRGNETKQFSFEKLKNQNSNSLVNHALTVEFTGNPAWYAVQALPYLMEYPYECAEQTFNRFYANALAAHIVAQSPKVKEIFNQWKNADSAALLSNLEKNQELKSALLEETPWVMEAKDETEQKHRIALLFETHKLAQNLNGNLRKLEQMQMPEGAFPWFKGMRPNRYITQYILTGIGRLRRLGVTNADYKQAKHIVSEALPYLDGQLAKDYEILLENKADLSKQQVGHIQIQYLYMRSFYNEQPIPTASQKAFTYYKKQIFEYWNQFNPYMKGMIALALSRSGEKETSQQIMASLSETAIHNDEMGMYWKNMSQGYWWHQAPIEAQSLLISAFFEITHDDKSVDDMKIWLLKQKQTQNWKTTKATADACYALLLNSNDWLENQPEVIVHLGEKTIQSSETETGTGYFKQRIEGDEVKPAMGNISVKINQVEDEGVAWGAVYWQYFEDLDKITAAETPLSLKKQLFIERNTDRGPVLTEIKDDNALKVGDKVKVRIVLRVDRDMEYVHLKDMRAACFEPVNVLSGYRYQGGLGYYESTKDISTNFFFDYLPKGTYVFEYPVFVGQKGDFSNGISTIQCMYAPEFSSHSNGIRVRVK